jgi:hypothetical protein
MMQGIPSSLAAELSHALLRNFVDQKDPPYSIWHSDEAGSIVIGMASRFYPSFNSVSWCFHLNCWLYELLAH